MKFSFRNNRLVKDTFVYTATDALGKAISFILLPFVSYYLSPEGLGMATNFSMLASIVNLLAGLAIINSLPYFFYERSKEDNKILVSNLIIMSLIACFALLFIIILGHRLIYRYIKIGFVFQLLTIPYVIASVIANLNLQLFRLENKPKSFAIYQIAQIFFHCVLVIVFVIVLRAGGEGKIIAELLTLIGIGVVHLFSLIKRGYIQLKYDGYCMGKLLKFGLPLMPHSISFWLKGGTDKIFITSFCGLAANGIYSMALSISSLYSMVSNSFFNAYVPSLQKKLTEINPHNKYTEEKKIVKTIFFLIGLFFLFSIAAIFASWVIIKFIIDEKYGDAFNYIPGIILSLFIYAVYSFSIQFIYKQKKTLILGLITFIGALIQMVLSYILVREFGIMGAVYSSIIGAIIISIGVFVYSQKVYPLPWLYFLKKESRNRE